MSTAARRQALVRKLKPLGLDVAIVSKPTNVTYLTGFTGEASYLILGRKSILMVSDGRFEQQLKEECPGLPVHIRPPTTTTPPVVAETVAKLGYRRVGIEAAHVTVALLDLWKHKASTVDWSPTSRLVEDQRAIKDAGEIEQIREAIGVAEPVAERVAEARVGQRLPGRGIDIARFRARPDRRHRPFLSVQNRLVDLGELGVVGPRPVRAGSKP